MLDNNCNVCGVIYIAISVWYCDSLDPVIEDGYDVFSTYDDCIVTIDVFRHIPFV